MDAKKDEDKFSWAYVKEPTPGKYKWIYDLDLTSMYPNIIELLQKHQIPYDEYDHDPIVSYEDAEREKERFSWVGIESKNVFLSGIICMLQHRGRKLILRS